MENTARRPRRSLFCSNASSIGCYSRVNWHSVLSARICKRSTLQKVAAQLSDLPTEDSNVRAPLGLTLDLEQSDSTFKRWKSGFDKRVSQQSQQAQTAHEEKLKKIIASRIAAAEARNKPGLAQRRAEAESKLESSASVILAEIIAKVRQGKTLDQQERDALVALLNEPSKATARMKRLGVTTEEIDILRSVASIGIAGDILGDTKKRRPSRSLEEVVRTIEVARFHAMFTEGMQEQTLKLKHATENLYGKLSEIFGIWERESKDAKEAGVLNALQETYGSLEDASRNLLDIMKPGASSVTKETMERATDPLSDLIEVLTKASGALKEKTEAQVETEVLDATARQVAVSLWDGMIRKEYDRNPDLLKEDLVATVERNVRVIHTATLLSKLDDKKCLGIIQSTEEREALGETREHREKVVNTRLEQIRTAYQRDKQAAIQEGKLREFYLRYATNEWHPYYLAIDEEIEEYNRKIRSDTNEQLAEELPVASASSSEKIGSKVGGEFEVGDPGYIPDPNRRRKKVNPAPAAAAAPRFTSPTRRSAANADPYLSSTSRTIQHNSEAHYAASMRGEAGSVPVAESIADTTRLGGASSALFEDSAKRMQRDSGQILRLLARVAAWIWHFFLQVLPFIKEGDVYPSSQFIAKTEQWVSDQVKRGKMDASATSEEIEEKTANGGFLSTPLRVIYKFSRLVGFGGPRAGLSEMATYIDAAVSGSTGDGATAAAPTISYGDFFGKYITDVNQLGEDDFTRDAKMRENQEWIEAIHPGKNWRTLEEKYWKDVPWKQYALSRYLADFAEEGYIITPEQRESMIKSRIPRASWVRRIMGYVFISMLGIFVRGNPGHIVPKLNEDSTDAYIKQLNRVRQDYQDGKIKEAEAAADFGAKAAVAVQLDTASRALTQAAMGEKNPCRTREIGSNDALCLSSMLKANVMVCDLHDTQEKTFFRSEAEKDRNVQLMNDEIKKKSQETYLSRLQERTQQESAEVNQRTLNRLPPAKDRATIEREHAPKEGETTVEHQRRENLIETLVSYEEARARDDKLLLQSGTFAPFELQHNVGVKQKDPKLYRAMNRIEEYNIKSLSGSSMAEQELRQLEQSRMKLKLASEQLFDAEMRDPAVQKDVNERRKNRSDIYAIPELRPYIHKLPQPMVTETQAKIETRGTTPETGSTTNMLDTIIDISGSFSKATTPVIPQLSTVANALYSGSQLAIQGSAKPPADRRDISDRSNIAEDDILKRPDKQMWEKSLASMESFERVLATDTALKGAEAEITLAHNDLKTDLQQNSGLDNQIKQALSAHMNQDELFLALENIQSTPERNSDAVVKLMLASFEEFTSGSPTAAKVVLGTSSATKQDLLEAASRLQDMDISKKLSGKENGLGNALRDTVADGFRQAVSSLEEVKDAPTMQTKYRVKNRNMELRVTERLKNAYSKIFEIQIPELDRTLYTFVPTEKAQVAIERGMETLAKSGDTEATEAMASVIAGMRAANTATQKAVALGDFELKERLQTLTDQLRRNHEVLLQSMRGVIDVTRQQENKDLEAKSTSMQDIIEEQNRKTVEAVANVEELRAELRELELQADRIEERNRVRQAAAREAEERVISSRKAFKENIAKFSQEPVSFTAESFQWMRGLISEYGSKYVSPTIFGAIRPSSTPANASTTTSSSSSDTQKSPQSSNVFESKVPIRKITEAKRGLQSAVHEEWADRVKSGADPKESNKPTPDSTFGGYLGSSLIEWIYSSMYSPAFSIYNEFMRLKSKYFSVPLTSGHESFLNGYEATMDFVCTLHRISCLTLVGAQIMPYLVKKITALATEPLSFLYGANGAITNAVQWLLGKISPGSFSLSSSEVTKNLEFGKSKFWLGAEPLVTFPGFIGTLLTAFLGGALWATTGWSEATSLVFGGLVVGPYAAAMGAGLFGGVFGMVHRLGAVGLSVVCMALMVLSTACLLLVSLSSLVGVSGVATMALKTVFDTITSPGGTFVGYTLFTAFLAEMASSVIFMFVNDPGIGFYIANATNGRPHSYTTGKYNATSRIGGFVDLVGDLLQWVDRDLFRNIPTDNAAAATQEEDVTRRRKLSEYYNAKARRLLIMLGMFAYRVAFSILLTQISGQIASGIHRMMYTQTQMNGSMYTSVDGQKYVVYNNTMLGLDFFGQTANLGGAFPRSIQNWPSFRTDRVTYTGPLYPTPDYVDTPFATRGIVQLMSNSVIRERYGSNITTDMVMCMEAHRLGELQIVERKGSSGLFADQIVSECLQILDSTRNASVRNDIGFLSAEYLLSFCTSQNVQVATLFATAFFSVYSRAGWKLQKS